MSFSVGTDAHSAADIRSAVEHVEPGSHLSDRQLELLRHGKELAIAALNEGAVGDADAEREDTYFKVSISGHGGGTSAQPGDSLVVSLAQVEAPEPPAPETA